MLTEKSNFACSPLLDGVLTLDKCAHILHYTLIPNTSGDIVILSHKLGKVEMTVTKTRSTGATFEREIAA